VRADTTAAAVREMRDAGCELVGSPVVREGDPQPS
jgi:hypothetical protein